MIRYFIHVHQSSAIFCVFCVFVSCRFGARGTVSSGNFIYWCGWISRLYEFVLYGFDTCIGLQMLHDQRQRGCNVLRLVLRGNVCKRKETKCESMNLHSIEYFDCCRQMTRGKLPKVNVVSADTSCTPSNTGCSFLIII